MPKSAPRKSTKYHLHVENGRKRPEIFQLSERIYAAAEIRHRALAKRLDVTIGWDGDILDTALQNADFAVSASRRANGCASVHPRLKWFRLPMPASTI